MYGSTRISRFDVEIFRLEVIGHSPVETFERDFPMPPRYFAVLQYSEVL